MKQEIYRVAERHALKGTTLKVLVVSNGPSAVPRVDRIECGPKALGRAQIEQLDRYVL